MIKQKRGRMVWMPREVLEEALTIKIAGKYYKMNEALKMMAEYSKKGRLK